MAHFHDLQIRDYMSKESGKVKLQSMMEEMVWESILDYEEVSEQESYPDNLAWVVASWDIDFYKIPEYKGIYRFSTYSPGYRSYIALRDFKVEEDGELLVHGKTVYSVIDMDTRSMVKIPEGMGSTFKKVDRQLIGSYRPSIPDLGEDTRIKKFAIRKEDYDINGHVNNAVYMGWLEEILTPEEYLASDYKNLLVEYKKEIREDKEVSLVYERLVRGYNVRILGEEGDEKSKLFLTFNK